MCRSTKVFPYGATLSLLGAITGPLLVVLVGVLGYTVGDSFEGLGLSTRTANDIRYAADNVFVALGFVGWPLFAAWGAVLGARVAQRAAVAGECKQTLLAACATGLCLYSLVHWALNTNWVFWMTRFHGVPHP